MDLQNKFDNLDEFITKSKNNLANLSPKDKNNLPKKSPRKKLEKKSITKIVSSTNKAYESFIVDIVNNKDRLI